MFQGNQKPILSPRWPGHPVQLEQPHESCLWLCNSAWCPGIDLWSWMPSCAMIYRTRVWRTDRKASSYQRLSRFDWKKKVYRSSFIALQYLYLLFDVDNPVNLHASNYLFTTEGHILPISNRSSKLSTWLVYLLFDTVYIGFVTKAGKRKAFSATTHQIHLHPLLLPSPIQGSFVTESSAYF